MDKKGVTEPARRGILLQHEKYQASTPDQQRRPSMVVPSSLWPAMSTQRVTRRVIFSLSTCSRSLVALLLVSSAGKEVVCDEVPRIVNADE